MTCGFSEPCHDYEVMPSLEAVCGRLSVLYGWIPKVIWGGALCFIPVINLFAFGYLLEYAKQIRHSSDWDLPDWNQHQFSTLFLNGFRFLTHFGLCPVCPLLLGYLLSMLILGMSFGMLGIIAYFPLAAAGFLGPFLFFLLSTSTWKTVSLVKASVSNPLINRSFPLA